jgi:hypothetical protein
VGGGSRWEKGMEGEYNANKCVHMYISEKMIPTEVVQGIGERGHRDYGGGVSSTLIHLINCKNFYKCPSIPLPGTIKIKKGKKLKITIQKKEETYPSPLCEDTRRKPYENRKDSLHQKPDHPVTLISNFHLVVYEEFLFSLVKFMPSCLLGRCSAT